MIDWLIPVMLAAAMLYVCYSDATRYIIPNGLVGLLLLLYPLWLWLAPVPVDWMGGLMMAGVLLAFGFCVFAIGILGAGDAKLLAALGLYTGWGQQGLAFIVHMALIGGILAIVLAALRRIYQYRETKPKILQPKAPVPYGIAIAIAFLMALATGRLEGMAGGFL